MVAELDGDEITVDARLWPALVAAMSGGTVGEIGDALDLGDLDATRLIRDLVDLGVTTVELPAAPRTRPTATTPRGSIHDPTVHPPRTMR